MIYEYKFNKAIFVALYNFVGFVAWNFMHVLVNIMLTALVCDNRVHLKYDTKA